MILIPREICRNPELALAREWRVDNGQGSYAASTICGANTRRYHGLLVSSLEPPVGRTVMLAKIDEELEVEELNYRLGTNEYSTHIISPDGYLYLEQVIIDQGIPSFRYQTRHVSLTKTIWMEEGRDTTYINYALATDSSPVRMTILPLCDYRDSRDLTRGRDDWKFNITVTQQGFEVKAHENALPYRVLVLPHAGFTPLDMWYWRFQFRADEHAGGESSSDLYAPGLLRADLQPGDFLTLIATREEDHRIDFDVERARNRSRARGINPIPPEQFTPQHFLAENF